MGRERRRHPRSGFRVDGIWTATGGPRPCSISDVSQGGCFVQSLAVPAVGERTSITVQLPTGPPIDAVGTVVQVEDGIGFSLRFDPMDPADEERLRRFVESTAGPGPRE